MYYQLDNNGKVTGQFARPQGFETVYIATPKPDGDCLWNGEQWVPDLDKPAILAAYRYEQETGGITVGGVAVRTDRETQAMLHAARTAAKEDNQYSVAWKAQNGFFTLNAAQIIGVADAVHAHVQGCFMAEAAVDLDECDTEQEIRNAFDAAMQG